MSFIASNSKSFLIVLNATGPFVFDLILSPV